jgi:anti-sigma B factor antagonist
MLGKRRGGPDRLEIETALGAGRADLRLAGELTLATAGRFLEELIDVEDCRPEVLVIDLRRLRFIDSVAIGELVAAHKRSRGAGRRLVLVTAEGPIARLLALTGLDGQFETAGEPPGSSPQWP